MLLFLWYARSNGMVWYGMVWYGYTLTNHCKFEIEFATENFTGQSIGKFNANLY